MTAFHVIGALTAIWAVFLAGIGIRNEEFPGGLEKIVGAISVLLVVGTISAAVITSKDEDEGGHEEATSEAQ